MLPLKNTNDSYLLDVIRLDLLLKNHVGNFFMDVVFTVGFTYLIFRDNYTDQLLTWNTAYVAVALLRMYVLGTVINKRKQGFHHNQIYLITFICSTFIAGLFWAVFAYLFMPDTSNLQLYLSFFIYMVVLCSASLATMSASLLSLVAFLVPIMLALSFRLYQLEQYVLTLGMFAYSVFLISSAVTTNKVFMDSMRISVENEKLAAGLSIAKNIAEQANIEKSHFLAAASHDLRQPLNSMGLFLYALRQRLKPVSDKKPITILNQIDSSYLALTNLFNSLLEISRLDAGIIHAEDKNVTLKFILGPLTDEMSEEAAAKGLKLTYHPTGHSIKTDPILLSRVLRNIIGNAIKYTKIGAIDVVESIDGNFVCLKIIDTGIGIPEEEFKNIFNEYYQLANKKRDRRAGIGLGLSIVKKMCDIIGAQITVESTVAQGSTFTLRLPIAVEGESLGDSDDSSAQENYEPRSLEGIRILVIDDDIEILHAMKLLLLDWKCKVDIAEDEQHAAELAKKNIPDLILCDYRLQDNMNGIEAIEIIQREINKDVKTIIISGDTSPDLLKMVEHYGYTMLSKPIRPTTLHKEIELTLAEN